ncbi:MAG: hypothetical protein K2N67_04395 [Mucispirillum sp.]|nr:hypothetical protein [Mucispirillum sp.]
MNRKNGYVPKAIYKEGIGDIDFVYGEAGESGTAQGYGLAHIIRRRNEEGKDGEAFVKQLPEIIKKGKVFEKEGHPNRKYIFKDDKEGAIRLDYDGKDKIWLVSAYIIKKP